MDIEEEKTYEIRFQPLKEMFGTGNEPFFLFQALSELGPLTVKLDETELPGFDAMAMDDSYLAWDLTLTTKEPKSAVESVFEFVEGLCELSIVSDKDSEDEAAALAALNAAFGVPGESAEPEPSDPFEALGTCRGNSHGDTRNDKRRSR